MGPLLKLLKMRKSQDGLESLPDTLSAPSTPCTPCPTSNPMQGPPFYTVRSDAPNCCTINILAEPPPGQPIRADIVLIHGLHGSLVNTWKQGLWQNDRQPVEFERPPRPPVRPPKRPRHSRSAAIHPAPREKRAKFASLNRCMDTPGDSPVRRRTRLQKSMPMQPEDFQINASDSDDSE